MSICDDFQNLSGGVKPQPTSDPECRVGGFLTPKTPNCVAFGSAPFFLKISAADEAGAGVYAPMNAIYRPEIALFYQLVEEYEPAFVTQLSEQGTELPECLLREIEDYLKCGCLE
jgi:hypothetical protein